MPATAVSPSSYDDVALRPSNAPPAERDSAPVFDCKSNSAPLSVANAVCLVVMPICCDLSRSMRFWLNLVSPVMILSVSIPVARPLKFRPLLFRLVTGRLPFNASNQLSLTYEILNVAPPVPSQLRPELPALLDEICLKAMRKNAKDRYDTWIDFGKDLSKAFSALRLAGETISDSAKFTELRTLSFFEDFDDVTLWEALRIWLPCAVAHHTNSVRFHSDPLVGGMADVVVAVACQALGDS